MTPQQRNTTHMPLSHDLRAGFQGLRANPGFSIVAVLTLALGIGANASIFSVINAILFRPLPVERPSELVSFNETVAGDTGPMLSYPNYRDFRDRNTVLTGLATYGFIPSSVGLKGNTQRMWGYMVSGNYFDLMRLKPYMGRLIGPEDDKDRGGHPVVVLSYAAWQKRFGGDPAIVGSKVQVNGREFTLLGVAPQGFFGSELFIAPEVFFSIAMQKELEGGAGNLDARPAANLFVIGRLKPGITMAQAESALNGIAQQLAQEYPREDSGIKITLSPPGLAGSFLRDATIGFTVVMLGVSGLVLLVACTNLASMLLARASDKRKQTAIRLALGASRGTLIRQLLTENLILALLGGMAGAVLSIWITNALAAWRPPVDIPIVVNAPVDLRVFLFALAVASVTALLFGLLPALQAAKTDLVTALKNEAAVTRFRYWHLRDYMVAVQVCLSVVLIFCSVLVVKSLQRSLDAPVGYQPRGLATASFDLNTQGYNEARGRDFERRILDTVRNIQGVESAALVSGIPLTLGVASNHIYIEGKPIPKRAQDIPVAFEFMTTPGYFHTAQTRLISGREFDDRDKPGSKRVAIVNSTFAKQLLPEGTPLGRRFTTNTMKDPIEIVGVVESGKYQLLNEQPKPAFWTPLAISYASSAAVIVRTPMNAPETLVPAIRNAVRDLDPSIALFGTGRVEDQLSLTFFPARIAALTLSAFGILALVLAATGIYGVTAYAVSRRTREIGIRLAIGATRTQVLEAVAGRAATLIGTGLVVGLGIAFAAGRLLGRILYGVKPEDPQTFVIVFALMATVGVAATFLPARRATRIDPMQSLRQE